MLITHKSIHKSLAVLILLIIPLIGTSTTSHLLSTSTPIIIGEIDDISPGFSDTTDDLVFLQDAWPLQALPILYNESPTDGSTDVTRPPLELNISLLDGNHDLMDATINWLNHSGQWISLISYAGVGDGYYRFIPPAENDWIWGNTTYYWSVNVTDGYGWVNHSYEYTTGGSRYDVSNNDIVNFQDAGLVWVHRTTQVSYDGLYDVNDDGQVNFMDAGLTWVNRD